MTNINKCPVCHESTEGQHLHALEAVHRDSPIEPLAFTVNAQGVYNRASSVARLLALARQELKLYFPEQEFDILPWRSINTGLGESVVVMYLVVEK